MAFLEDAAIHPMILRELLILCALYAQIRFAVLILIDVFDNDLAPAFALPIVRLHDTPPAWRVANGRRVRLLSSSPLLLLLRDMLLTGRSMLATRGAECCTGSIVQRRYPLLPCLTCRSRDADQTG